jgi:hypothetical protein
VQCEKANVNIVVPHELQELLAELSRLHVDDHLTRELLPERVYFRIIPLESQLMHHALLVLFLRSVLDSVIFWNQIVQSEDKAVMLLLFLLRGTLSLSLL